MAAAQRQATAPWRRAAACLTVALAALLSPATAHDFEVHRSWTLFATHAKLVMRLKVTASGDIYDVPVFLPRLTGAALLDDGHGGHRPLEPASPEALGTSARFGDAVRDYDAEDDDAGAADFVSNDALVGDVYSDRRLDVASLPPTDARHEGDIWLLPRETVDGGRPIAAVLGGEKRLFKITAYVGRPMLPLPREVKLMESQMLYFETRQRVGPLWKGRYRELEKTSQGRLRSLHMVCKDESVDVRVRGQIERTSGVAGVVGDSSEQAGAGGFAHTRLISVEFPHAASDNVAYVHVVINDPLPRVTRFERTVEVSHWGWVSVTEKYALRHDGPALAGPFQRVSFAWNDYQNEAMRRYEAPGALLSLEAHLPKLAKTVHFRDQIGNVSTSNAWRDDGSVRVELQPRFPLVGQWATDFEVSYVLPSSSALLRAHDEEGAATNQFVLQVPLSPAVAHVFVDEYQQTVLLPENSRAGRFEVPSRHVTADEAETLAEGIRSTLDVGGRVAHRLRLKNLFVPRKESLARKMRLFYRFEQGWLVAEPLMLALLVAAFLGGHSLVRRLRMPIATAKEREDLERTEEDAMLAAAVEGHLDRLVALGTAMRAGTCGTEERVRIRVRRGNGADAGTGPEGTWSALEDDKGAESAVTRAPSLSEGEAPECNCRASKAFAERAECVRAVKALASERSAGQPPGWELWTELSSAAEGLADAQCARVPLEQEDDASVQLMEALVSVGGQS